MLSTRAEVERDNRRDGIDATEFVPGDIVGIVLSSPTEVDVAV